MLALTAIQRSEEPSSGPRLGHVRLEIVEPSRCLSPLPGQLTCEGKSLALLIKEFDQFDECVLNLDQPWLDVELVTQLLDGLVQRGEPSPELLVRVQELAELRIAYATLIIASLAGHQPPDGTLFAPKEAKARSLVP